MVVLKVNGVKFWGEEIILRKDSGDEEETPKLSRWYAPPALWGEAKKLTLIRRG